MMVGGVLSTLLTVKVQVAVLPLASVAVRVTVISPTPPTVAVGGGDWLTVRGPGQLSLAVARPV
jgi:hypothetical protein